MSVYGINISHQDKIYKILLQRVVNYQKVKGKLEM